MSGDLGHGHVRPRPDGVKARCGGPGLCAACAREAAAVSADRPAPPAPDTVTDDVVEAFRTGLYVHFCEGCEHGTAGVAWAECCLRAGLEAVVPLIRERLAAELAAPAPIDGLRPKVGEALGATAKVDVVWAVPPQTEAEQAATASGPMRGPVDGTPRETVASVPPPGWCRWHQMVDCHGDAPECRQARAEIEGRSA